MRLISFIFLMTVVTGLQACAPKTVQVTLDAQGGETPTPFTFTLTVGKPYGQLPATVRVGHSFEGWQALMPSGDRVWVSEDTLVTWAADHTLYAQWKTNRYVVRFEANEGSAPSFDSKPLSFGEPYGDMPSTSRTGHTLLGWLRPDGQEVFPATPMNWPSDHSLLAQWRANTYPVTFHFEDGVTEPLTRNVVFGQVLGLLPSPLRVGSTFHGWWTNPLGEGTLIRDSEVMSTPQALSLYARWFGVAHVAAGSNASCRLSASGRALCWGYNPVSLGDGSSTSSLTPLVLPEIFKVRSISAGGSHFCALSEGQGVACWGRNDFSQLGDGGTRSALVPTVLANSRDWRDVSTGYRHTCAVSALGDVLCWGFNDNGQLGVGHFSTLAVPSKARGLGDASWVNAGTSHSCAVTRAGRVWCWGDNTFGQIGRETVAPAVEPLEVSELTNMKGVVAGSAHTCAWSNEGSVWCWGDNSSGQLGTGSNVATRIPSPVQGLPPVYVVSSRGDSTCALTLDQEVYCWGNNDFGQLGLGSTLSVSSPQKVGNLPHVRSLSAGYTHTCAATSEGRAFCWGENFQGQLGNGTVESTTVPVPVQSVETE